MHNIYRWALIFTIGLSVLGTSAAYGQAFPSRPVRIVTTPTGGGGDTAARLIAQVVSGPLGQPVLVDNRANAVVGGLVAKSPPDGYTLVLLGNVLWIMPLIEDMSYDPINDFSPVTLVNKAPNILGVNPSLPVKSVKDLIALAKAKPGVLNYAETGLGSGSFLAAELFKSMAGVDIVEVSFRGGPLAVTAVISGDVQVHFSSTIGEQVKSGQLRGLAVTSAQPSALVPGLPTVAETLPGFVSEVVQVLSAPAKTPDAVINRLNQEFTRALARPDLKEKFFNTGSEAAPSSPEEAAATIKADMTKMAALIKEYRAKSQAGGK